MYLLTGSPTSHHGMTVTPPERKPERTHEKSTSKLHQPLPLKHPGFKRMEIAFDLFQITKHVLKLSLLEDFFLQGNNGT